MRFIREMSMFQSLYIPSFRRLWLIVAFTNAASWAFTVAIGWQIYAVTHSSLWAGAAMFATLAPNTVGAPIAGVLADRLNRKRLITYAVACAAGTNLCLAIVSIGHVTSVFFLLVLTVFFGTANSVAGIALNSILPSLVPEGALFNAISLQGVAQRGTEFVGPLLATPLLAYFGVGTVYLFALVLNSIAFVMVKSLTHNARGQTIGKGLFRPLAEGFRYIMRSRTISVLVGVVGAHCILTMAYMGVFPDFVNMELHGSSSFFSLLISAIGLGAMVGTLVLASVTNERVRGSLLWVTGLLSGAMLLALALSRTHTALMVSVFAVGASQSMFMTLSIAYVQRSVEDHVRGRMMSVFMLLAAGGMAIGNWAYGAIAMIVAPHVILEWIGSSFVVFLCVLRLASASFRTLCRSGASDRSATNRERIVEVSG